MKLAVFAVTCLIVASIVEGSFNLKVISKDKSPSINTGSPSFELPQPSDSSSSVKLDAPASLGTSSPVGSKDQQNINSSSTPPATSSIATYSSLYQMANDRCRINKDRRGWKTICTFFFPQEDEPAFDPEKCPRLGDRVSRREMIYLNRRCYDYRRAQEIEKFGEDY